ncbi:MAG: polymerase sigma factor [Conexibacter sp.]|nr:polymerase sigma factor [Conexibacter sp.]
MPQRLIESTDVQLMARIQGGDPDAFSVLYDRFGDRAYRVAYGITHEATRAEDVVQDAFLSVWRNRARFRAERGSAQAWILGVVRNRAIDTLRRHRRHDHHRADVEELDDHGPCAQSVEHMVLQRDQAAGLRGVVALLPVSQREVIALAYYGQLTVAEIAGELALPLGTVKGRMRLGLGTLRDRGAAYAPC